MPDSMTSSNYPVGIVISPGSTRTTSARLWAFLWSAEREPDAEPWHRPRPRDKNP